MLCLEARGSPPLAANPPFPFSWAALCCFDKVLIETRTTGIARTKAFEIKTRFATFPLGEERIRLGIVKKADSAVLSLDLVFIPSVTPYMDQVIIKNETIWPVQRKFVV